MACEPAASFFAGGGPNEDAATRTRESRNFSPNRAARNLFLDLGSLLAELPSRLKDPAPINPIGHDGYIGRIEALL